MRKRILAVELGAFAAFAALFRLFPEIDLEFSRLFYRPGEGFYLSQNPAVLFVYHAVRFMLMAAMGGSALVYGLNRFRGWRIIRLNGRGLAYLVLSLLIGPGWLVHNVLKNHWGRPRPASVEEFGGTKRFMPAFVMSSECAKNCSFVSGHASAGFFLVSFGLLPEAANPLAVGIGLAAGLGIGLGRIMQGGHFLSDVIFAGFFTCFVAQLLKSILLRDPSPSK